MKSLKIAALISALAVPAVASDLDNLTSEERASFREEVRAYLLDNPEVLLEAMQVLRDREQQAESQADAQILSQNSDEIFNDGISYVGGNLDGDITIVEFLDYRCGYCRKAHADMAKLLETDGNIRWVVKEFPILGADSDASSRMAIATLRHYGNEAYLTLHDILMTFQGPVNAQTMPTLAEQAGIEFEPLVEIMESPEVSEHIARVRALGSKLQVSGTPSFVIEDTILRGYLPLPDMENIVAEVRAQ
ncbi:DsbA family protein [Neptunicoccus cionae]|uniref:DsbA family protein n=1 Tax=Neptunicoccus cionae TaxID=2035344 RepID=UPI000C76132F|nr:DsbA family protein [Amylibacter cionae]PLS20958.1 disulfide bond formation protein DsbA [Amylibacter cionae]